MSQEAKFIPTISNEQTAELPAAQFPGKIVIVESLRSLESACKELSKERIIGFDTETRPSFKAGVQYRVSLLQLSTEKRCYLIRLSRIPLDKQILKILENPKIIKVGAAVSGDISSLKALRHFREAGFVDLQSIAGMWGIEEKSLRKLSAITLGHRVSKAQRLSNWEAATLTPQQQMYAATDAWVSLMIYLKLNSVPKSNTER
ncbi:MAG: 3'-5' exonuclease [Alistipes sp.]|nr:3'-5' exonuclease [Alistipes sp.]